jgi:hypothetical protein
MANVSGIRGEDGDIVDFNVVFLADTVFSSSRMWR